MFLSCFVLFCFLEQKIGYWLVETRIGNRQVFISHTHGENGDGKTPKKKTNTESQKEKNRFAKAERNVG